MAESLGSLFVDIGLNNEPFYRQLADAKAQAFATGTAIEQKIGSIGRTPLGIKVDDSRLFELNKHLDLKVAHLKQVQQVMNSNPLKVQVDSREMDLLEKRYNSLASAQQKSRSVSNSASVQPINTSGSTSYKADKSSATSFDSSAIVTELKLIRKDLAGVRSNQGKTPSAVSSIKTGLFEGFGQNFGQQISQEFQRSAKKNLGADAVKSAGKAFDAILDPSKYDGFEDKLIDKLEEFFVYTPKAERASKAMEYAKEFSAPLREQAAGAVNAGIKVAAYPAKIRKKVNLARSAELAKQISEELEVPDIENVESIRRIALLSGGVELDGKGRNAFFARNIMKGVLGEDTATIPVRSVYSNDPEKFGGIFAARNAVSKAVGGITGSDPDDLKASPIDKLIHLALESGFNPDSVMVQATKLAYEKKYPGKEFLFGGSSAGSIVAEEATAISERSGASNVKGFGLTLGLNGTTNTASAENFKAFTGSLDPLFMAQFGTHYNDESAFSRGEKRIFQESVDSMPFPKDLFKDVFTPTDNTVVVQNAGAAHHLGQFVANQDTQKQLQSYLGLPDIDPQHQGKDGTKAAKAYADMFGQGDRYESLGRTINALIGDITALNEIEQGKYSFVNEDNTLRKTYGPSQEKSDLEYSNDDLVVGKQVKGQAVEDAKKLKSLMSSMAEELAKVGKESQNINVEKIEEFSAQFDEIFGIDIGMQSKHRDMLAKVAQGQEIDAVDRSIPSIAELRKRQESERLKVKQSAYEIPLEIQPSQKSIVIAKATELASEAGEKVGILARRGGSAVAKKAGEVGESVAVSRMNSQLSRVPGDSGAINTRQISSLSDLSGEDYIHMAKLGGQDVAAVASKAAGLIQGGGRAALSAGGQALKSFAALKSQREADAKAIAEATKQSLEAIKAASDTAQKMMSADPSRGGYMAGKVQQALPGIRSRVDEAIKALPASERMSTKAGSQLANIKSQIEKQESRIDVVIQQIDDISKPSELSGSDRLALPQGKPGIPASEFSRQIKAIGQEFSAQSKAIAYIGDRDEDKTRSIQAARELLESVEIARNTISELIAGVGKKGTPELRKAAGVARGQITKADKRVRQYSAEGEDIGSNIGEGLSKGIVNKIADAKSSAIELAKGVIEVTEDALEIKSPSKAFERIGNFVVEGFEAGLQGFSAAGSVIDKAVESMSAKFPSLANEIGLVGTGIKNLVPGFLAFQAAGFIIPMLQQFASESFQVAIEMEKIGTKLKFIEGSAREAQSSMSQLFIESKSLGTDAFADLEGYSKIKAASRGTSLEGYGSEQLFEAGRQASLVYQLDGEEQSRVFTAFEQMISKGNISAEELRQQLSEHLPGAFQVAARSMGVTTAELNKMLERGDVLSSEFLPRFAQQLSSETSSGVAGASKTTQAAINRLGTTMLELKAGFGEGLLPVRKLGLTATTAAIDLVSGRIGIIMSAASLLAAQAILPLGRAIGSLLLKLGLLPRTLSLSSAVMRTAAASAGIFLGKMILLQAAITAGTVAWQLFTDASGGMKGIVDSNTKSLDQLIDKLNGVESAADGARASLEAQGAIGGIKKTLDGFDSIGKNLNDSRTGQFFQNLTGSRMFAEPEEGKNGSLVNWQIRRQEEALTERFKEGSDNSRRTIEQSDSYLTGSNRSYIDSFNATESKLQQVQLQMQASKVLRPGSTEEMEMLREQEEELLKSRSKQVEAVGDLRASVESQIQFEESRQAELSEQLKSNAISSESYNEKMAESESLVRKLKTTQEEWNNALDKTANNLAEISRKLIAASDALNDAKFFSTNDANEYRAQIARGEQGGLTPGQVESANRLVDQQSLRAQMAAQQKAIDDTQKLLQSKDLQEGVSQLGADAFAGPSRLATLKQEFGEKSPKIEGALDALIQLRELEGTASELQLQIEQSSAEASTQLRETTREIDELFRTLANESANLALDTQRITNSGELARQTGKVKSAMIGFSKSFISDFGDSLIAVVEAFNEPLQNAIDAQQSILAAQQGYLSQAMGIDGMRRGLPGMGGLELSSGAGFADAAKSSTVVQAAESWVGEEFNEGVKAQCAYFVRAAFEQAGIKLGVSADRDSSGDPMAGELGAGFASSLIGADIGSVHKTSDPSSIPAGAIIGFKDTYGDFGADAITHVGISTGGGQMVDRSTSARPVTARPISTFADTQRGEYIYVIPKQIASQVIPSASGGGSQSASSRRSSGSLSLGSGYESLSQLGNQLMKNQYFNPTSPESAARLAIALGIGGSEAFGQNITRTDHFTQMGGTGKNMKGFAQFNQEYHAGRTGNPNDYMNFMGQILNGETATPNGRQAKDFGQMLADAVSQGSVQNGQQLIQWMQSSGLGGSNWQGVDDGWSRAPGLADTLVNLIRSPGAVAMSSGGGLDGSAVNAQGAMFNGQLDQAELQAASIRDGTIANIEETLRQQNVLSELNMQIAEQASIDGLTESRRQISEKHRGENRRLEDLGFEALPDTPNNELTQALEGNRRGLEDDLLSQDEYRLQLEQTIEQAMLMQQYIPGLGLDPAYTAEVLAKLGDVLVSANWSLNEANSREHETIMRYKEIENKLLEEFRLAEESRKLASRQQTFEIDSELVTAGFSQSMRIGEGRYVAEAQFNLAVEALEIEFDQKVLELETMVRDELITAEEAASRRLKYEEIGELNFASLGRDRDQSLDQLMRSENSTLFDAQKGLAESIMRNYSMVGGTPWQASGNVNIEKELALMQQQFTYDSQLHSYRQTAQTEGHAPGKVAEVESLLARANEAEIANIGLQFNELKGHIDAARGATETLFESMIMGSQSAGEMLGTFFTSIAASFAKLASQKLTDSLFGAILGGTSGTGAGGGFAGLMNMLGFGGGGAAPAQSSPVASIGGGFISSLLGSIGGGGGSMMSTIAGKATKVGGFAGSIGRLIGLRDGGTVPHMDDGGTVRSMGSMAKYYEGFGEISAALKREGPNAILAALTPEEEVLSVSQARRFRQMGLDQVLNFRDGGTVGNGASFNTSSIKMQSSNSYGGVAVTVPVNVAMTSSGDTKADNDRANRLGDSLRDPIQALVRDAIAREQGPRGMLSK